MYIRSFDLSPKEENLKVSLIAYYGDLGSANEVDPSEDKALKLKKC